MAKNDHITVWMNGKKTEIKREETETRTQEEISEDEHAAAMDMDRNMENQPDYREDMLMLPKKDKHDVNPTSINPKPTHQVWKPIVITIIAAVCIGSIFGMIMLKMVGTFDQGGDGPSSASMAGNNTENKNEAAGNNEQNSSDAYDLPALKAYVVQGGVYEEESSVDDWKSTFQDAAFNPVVWERDDDYYLLVDIERNEKQAAQIAEDIQETYDLDVFAKEWQTEQAQLDLEESEEEWLATATELWEDSLEKLENDEDFSVDDWQVLIEDYPDEGDELESFKKEVEERIDDLDNPSDEEVKGFLLHVWQSIETDIEQAE